MTDPLVHTTLGPIPRSQLTVKDVVAEDGQGRTVATEWYYQGQMVRRSVWLDLYMPLALSGERKDEG